MQLKELTKDYLEQEYIKNGRSFTEIAKEIGVFPNTVRRIAIRMGIKTRNASKAQKILFKLGKREPCMKGKKHTATALKKISKSVAEKYNNFSEEKKQSMREQSRKRWEEMTEEQKADMAHKAAQRVREVGITGSKFERYILDFLRQHNFEVEFHKMQLIPNEKLEVDIYLPEIKTVIEIDGPTHFLPIYGDEALAKAKSSDNVKNGLVLSAGYWMIRVCDLRKSLSQHYMNTMSEKLLKILLEIKDGKRTSDAEKLIYVTEDN
jgi:very-short-patch-repair endonuclease